MLAEKIDEFVNGDQSRAAIVGRIKQKKTASADKKKRRKYKKLDDDKEDPDHETDPKVHEDVVRIEDKAQTKP